MTTSETSTSAASASSWILKSGEVDATLAELLEARVDAQRRAGLYTERDEQHVKGIELTTSRRDFVTSPERLERLRRLCQIYSINLRPEEISSHRKFIGPVIVAVKKALFRMLEGLLGKTIKHQRDFNSEVVALLTDLCNEADASRSR
jgi:hypothetical protein